MARKKFKCVEKLQTIIMKKIYRCLHSFVGYTLKITVDDTCLYIQLIVLQQTTEQSVVKHIPIENIDNDNYKQLAFEIVQQLLKSSQSLLTDNTICQEIECYLYRVGTYGRSFCKN